MLQNVTKKVEKTKKCYRMLQSKCVIMQLLEFALVCFVFANTKTAVSFMKRLGKELFLFRSGSFFVLEQKEKECCFCPAKIQQGDCLDLMQEITDKSIDLILCDLPYGTTACKWDFVIPYEPLWNQYKRIIKENGAIVLFATQPFTTQLIHSNFKDFRYCWYWKKNNVSGGTFAKVQPMRCIEDICVFYKHKPTYNPQGLKTLKNAKINKVNLTTEIYKWRGKTSIQKYTNYPKHLIEFSKDGEKLHPTQKPVPLLEYLIKTYTNEGENVLDNCMGSGSTGVACINTKRKFIGFEKEHKYFEIAKQRINNAVFSLQNS